MNDRHPRNRGIPVSSRNYKRLKTQLVNFPPKQLSDFFPRPAQLPCDGADGCQLVPGDSDGAGPRKDVLPALSDAVRHQTSALCRHHSQGGKAFAIFLSSWFPSAPVLMKMSRSSLNSVLCDIIKSWLLQVFFLHLQFKQNMYILDLNDNILLKSFCYTNIV